LLLALLLVSCGDELGVFPLPSDAGSNLDGSTPANGGDSGTSDAGDGGCNVDTSYAPAIDPASFTTTIDNPFFPLPVGARWTHESEDEIIRLEVLAETYTTANGVECVVVHDEVRSAVDDELIEDTHDWYAQDADGNVWYMGEETAEYENGQIVTTAGSWEAGVDGAQPGIIMHAVPPSEGVPYRQEYYPCEAEDMGEIYATDVSVTVPTGNYSGCLTTRDYTPLEPNVAELKTYCPGVGQVLIEDPQTGEVVEELTEIVLPGAVGDASDSG
jgi:hypothetical protein